ncbi:hypothetical protein ACN47E_005808 [Coniothyrium glycines]
MVTFLPENENRHLPNIVNGSSTEIDPTEKGERDELSENLFLFAEPDNGLTSYNELTSDDCENDYYTYEDLGDRTDTIRLLQIKSEPAAEGYLQCELRHASVHEAYNALSYVWGTSTTISIVVNGGLHGIRENLFDFLNMATRKPDLCEKWFWIDAICINQHNVMERNHQVQQMGRIYSGAEEVMAWLGKDTTLASFKSPADTRLEAHVNANEYWTRAWITQEVALARRVILMTLDGQLYLKDLPTDNSYGRRKITDLIMARDLYKGANLLFLLNLFRMKNCHDSRDRIFSLLALCREGHDIQVDYGASYHDLARQILRDCSSSFCLTSIHIIGTALSIKDSAEHETQHPNYRELPFVKLDVSILESSSGHILKIDPAQPLVRYSKTIDTEGRNITLFTLKMADICHEYAADLTIIFNEIDHSFSYSITDQTNTRQTITMQRSCGVIVRMQQQPPLTLTPFCTVIFSFEFLLELTRAWKGFVGHYCLRVAQSTTAKPQTCGTALLQFCDDNDVEGAEIASHKCFGTFRAGLPDVSVTSEAAPKKSRGLETLPQPLLLERTALATTSWEIQSQASNAIYDVVRLQYKI